MKSTVTALNYCPERFQLLSAEEAEVINGGETLLYWFAYGVGVVVHTLSRSNGTQSSGQKLMNSALS